MRLIDVDALIKEYEEIVETLADFCEMERMMCREVIRALQNAPTIEPSGDLISRKALIGAIEKCGEEKIYPQALIETIKAIPSAESVPIEDVWQGVQPLKDKILDLEEKLYRQNERQNGGDLISRADAIEAVESANTKDKEYHYYKHIAVDTLSALPSADRPITKGTQCQEKNDHSGEVTEMVDLISRADAICAIENTDCELTAKDWDELTDAIMALPSAETKWIPCNKRLPKKNEYVNNICKYYLIQDEYGDMHVAHLSERGWEPIESNKVLEYNIIAWMPLPKQYEERKEE